MDICLESSWKNLLAPEFEKPYMQTLKTFLTEEKRQRHIYPKGSEIFNALNTTPYEEVKVVILGQDPYHGEGQAHGLSFSVQKGVKIPPSLVNIYKEISDDLHLPMPKHGHLESWAKQGVLLLNAVLTVRAGEAASHQKKGWELFKDRIIENLSAREKPMVFMLWGGYARSKAKLIDQRKHLVLEAPHPSPLSAYRGFLGCKHFSKANAFNSAASKVMIIDNIGMLSSLYQYGKTAMIGGGFGSGIHNILEPIAFGLPVIFGKKYQKFEEANQLVETGGGFSILNFEQFKMIMEKLEKENF